MWKRKENEAQESAESLTDTGQSSFHHCHIKTLGIKKLCWSPDEARQPLSSENGAAVLWDSPSEAIAACLLQVSRQDGVTQLWLELRGQGPRMGREEALQTALSPSKQD
jgi:hypothetical protein